MLGDTVEWCSHIFYVIYRFSEFSSSFSLLRSPFAELLYLLDVQGMKISGGSLTPVDASEITSTVLT
jgi:hypothetical protein